MSDPANKPPPMLSTSAKVANGGHIHYGNKDIHNYIVCNCF